MKTTIALSGMEFYAHHGCFAEEKIIGTHFKVDVEMRAQVETAARQDDLSQTINYQLVHKFIEEEMAMPSDLLEHVAYRILLRLKREFAQVESAKVTVYKLNPPLGGKTAWASVTIEE